MIALKQYLLSLINEQAADEAIEKFELYREFLLEQNKLFNLTAITEPKEVETKHFIDSLAALKYLKGDILDIGSGAGFPSVPLAIMSPKCNFTLVDSLNKRVDFLISLFSKLSLDNCTAIHSRAEDLPKNKLYDVVVARAVSELNTLTEYCLPFVKIGGVFIAYKSNDCLSEINRAQNAINILGGEISKVEDFSVYSTDIVRKLIVIKKIKPSPDKYPRGQNKPKKQPL